MLPHNDYDVKSLKQYENKADLMMQLRSRFFHIMIICSIVLSLELNYNNWAVVLWFRHWFDVEKYLVD